MKRNFILIIFALIFCCTSIFLTSCSSDNNVTDDTADTADNISSVSKALDGIKEAGFLRVAVRTDVPSFGFDNPATGELEGLEIDIAREFAKELFENADAVEFIRVIDSERGMILDNEQADMVIATYTITEERLLSYNFSDMYYEDKIGFLVLGSSGISSISDLNQKKIGVVETTTTQEALGSFAGENNIDLEYYVGSSCAAVKALLQDETIDAISSDKSVLLGYLDGETKILDIAFDGQEYGVATRKEQEDFSVWVNDTLNKMKSDGTLDNLLIKWGL